MGKGGFGWKIRCMDESRVNDIDRSSTMDTTPVKRKYRIRSQNGQSEQSVLICSSHGKSSYSCLSKRMLRGMFLLQPVLASGLSTFIRTPVHASLTCA